MKASITYTKNGLEGNLDEYEKNFVYKDDCLEISNLSISVEGERVGNLIENIGRYLNVDTPIVSLKLYNVVLGFDKLPYYENIVIEKCNSGKKIVITGYNIEIIDSFFTNARLNAADTGVIKLCNTSLGRLRLYSDNDNKIQTTKAISIRNSIIDEFIGTTELLNSSVVVQFDAESEIKKEAEFRYRILKANAERLGDVVQSHIFHVKILQHSNFRTEDRFLRFLSWFSNNHGLSFVRPILLMVLVNTIAFSFFWCSGHWSIAKDVNPENLLQYTLFSLRDVSVVFDINALNGAVDKNLIFSDWKSTVDGVRRVLLGVLTYQAVIAARRFSFIKK